MRSLVYGLAAVIMLHCTNVLGAYITMASGFSVTRKPGGLTLQVTAENRGDEPAYGVQFEIVMADTTLISPAIGTLAANQKTSVEYSLADVFKLPGRYTIVIRTYYKGAHGNRYTALTTGYYDYNSSAKPAISITGQATEMPVDGKGRLEFMLRNDGNKAQQIALALFLPNELSTSNEKSVLTVGPQQSETVVYDVENFSATESSRYAVSLVGQYEDAGSHFGSTVVRVVGANTGSVQRPIWIWVVLSGLLPGVIVLLALQKKKTRSATKAELKCR